MGVLADRWNRHRLLILTQALSMVQALTLAILTLTGVITSKEVIAPAVVGLSAFLGLVNSLDIPVRQSFVVDMVEGPQDLPNAIALNSFLFNSARLVGPAIGGVLVAWLGVGACFLVNGLSFIAVIAALLAMRVTPRPHRPRRNPLHELREGFLYVVGFVPIRSLLLLLGLISFVGMPYAILIPVFARDVLHGPGSILSVSMTQGFLVGATGLGALSGAVFLASRKSVLGLGRLIPIAAALFGAGLVAFSLSRVLWLSLAIQFAAGFGMLVQMAASNTILQTITDDDKRGRVMSFYTMAFMGIGPFGSLLAGWGAQHVGAPAVMAMCGAAVILAALAFATQLPKIRRFVHPIYLRLGIISGLPAAETPTQMPESMNDDPKEGDSGAS
jgi:MFS family permease